MAAFPDYKILTSTSVSRDDGRRTAVAEGGQIRGRNAFEPASSVYRIHIVMALLVTERDALDTFYDTNSDYWNTISFDGYDYNTIFSTGPITTNKSGLYRTVEFDLLGYRV